MGEGEGFQLCDSHITLGHIYRLKREREKVIHHYDVALGIADKFNLRDQLFLVHDSLAILFRVEGEFDDVHAHIKQAEQYAVGNEYYLSCTKETRAQIWYRQGRRRDAESEVLCAIEMYEKLGAVRDLERCRTLLQKIRETAISSDESDPDGELPENKFVRLPS